MPNRADIEKEAWRWIGTPYHHQGRKPGASCDCIGFMIGMARNLGLPAPTERDIPNYAPWPHDHLAKRYADEYMDPQPLVPLDNMKAGQVGLFWFKERDHGQHFAVIGNHPSIYAKVMIHARIRYGTRGGEIEAAIVSDFWRKRLIGVYDFKGIADAAA